MISQIMSILRGPHDYILFKDLRYCIGSPNELVVMSTQIIDHPNFKFMNLKSAF